MEPATPLDSPLRMRDVLESPRYRNLMTAKVGVGDPAPAFTLPFLGRLDRTLSLESFRGDRPVVLIFGSYT